VRDQKNCTLYLSKEIFDRVSELSQVDVFASVTSYSFKDPHIGRYCNQRQTSFGNSNLVEDSPAGLRTAC